MAERAECVMLNKGPNLADGVGALHRLLKRMGEDQVKKTPTLRALHSWPEKHRGRRKVAVVDPGDPRGPTN